MAQPKTRAVPYKEPTIKEKKKPSIQQQFGEPIPRTWIEPRRPRLSTSELLDELNFQIEEAESCLRVARKRLNQLNKRLA